MRSTGPIVCSKAAPIDKKFSVAEHGVRDFPGNPIILERNKLPSGKDIIEQSEEYYNCQVLQCPEIRNFSSMVNDTRFEYYSLFANPPPPDNATCVPGLGMFIYFDKPENFSRAFNICREVNGSLAHILTEVRTNSLSKLIRIFYVVYLSADHICENTNTEHLLKFHPTRHCQRSNKSIVALGNFRTVKECEDFARESHALAFNYAPADRGTVNKYEKGNETSKGYVHWLENSLEFLCIHKYN
uniref:Uncharacterized protein n=1 Tax=Phlebotomus papatasi TaxID=29031 RepID=A0A1B0CYY2_PHLPP